MNRSGIVIVLVMVLSGCASIKQFQTIGQPIDQPLQTFTGGTILKIDREESLPNAFDRADVYGGRRPTGSIELKYLGFAAEGQIKLRVLSTDIRTTEDWRRRLGNRGTVTASSDGVDFEQELQQPFEEAALRSDLESHRVARRQHISYENRYPVYVRGPRAHRSPEPDEVPDLRG